MIIPYEDSQKSRLVDEVRVLCRELGRPVSSRDLMGRWREMPDRRPLLTQCVGQLLLKAARPVKGANPVLRQVGTIGNLGFYVGGEDPAWAESFRQHEIAVRASRHVKWAIPEHAAFLLGSEHDALAQNAMAGFVAEWSGAAEDPAIVLPSRLHELLDVAKNHAPGDFAGHCPKLINRTEAAAIILSEMRERNPLFCDSANLNRHLSRLSWPMTPLFTAAGFWEFQVRQYCLAKWPDETTDSIVANAVYRAAAYGNI